VIVFIVTAALLWPLPSFRVRVDRRESEGERYVSACVGVFQRAETWACVEVAR
jgi:hypothetical protein